MTGPDQKGDGTLDGANEVSAREAASAPAEHHLPGPWQNASLDNIVAQAKAEGKPILVYWGAVWCPPCNALKEQVFSHPDFENSVQGVLLWAIDGDSSEAQAIGEKLKAGGYPTVMLLSSEGQELARIDGALTFGEFKQFLTGAISQDGSMLALRKRVSQRALNEKDWLTLAMFDWAQQPEGSFWDWRMLPNLADKAPKGSIAKAMLAAHTLTMVGEHRQDKDVASLVKHIKDVRKTYVDLIFQDDKTVEACRQFIASGVESTLSWWALKKDSKEYKDLKKRWLEAAARIRQNSSTHLPMQLAALQPFLDFAHYENPDKPVPDDVKQLVRTTIADLAPKAATPFLKQSVLSEAGYFLGAIGDLEAAKKLLLDNAESAPSPSYFYSMLSYVEQEAKHYAEAWVWAKKASETAVGHAAKIQSLSSQLILATKHQDIIGADNLREVTTAFYQALFREKDGFLGRNHAREKRVSAALAPLTKKGQPLHGLRLDLEKNCQNFEAEQKERCTKHVRSIGLG